MTPPRVRLNHGDHRRGRCKSVPSDKASGKPWMPSIQAEDRVRFDERAGDLDLEFFDRDGAPMPPSSWLEARGDHDYVLIAADRLGDIWIATTWVGVHIPGSPGWDRVIFGSQVIDLTPETLARLAAEPVVERQPNEPYDVLQLLNPPEGQVVYRASFRTLSEAQRSHRFVRTAVSASGIASRSTT